MREIKFRVYDKVKNNMKQIDSLYIEEEMFKPCNGNEYDVFSYNNKYYSNIMQYTELKDKQGMGLTEVYEGDIIDENGIIKGNIYEMDARETDIVIPQLGTKAWCSAYKEAVDRGFDYSE